MARKELFIDVFETDTFNEWRLKTNSIKINLQDVYDELDTLDSRVVLLTGDQTINGVKSFIQKSKWTKEYTQNEVTPMLELRVTNSNSPTAGSNHKGSGPSIDFYNPDTTASDPGVYGSANATQDTWLASRIASVSENSNSAYSDSSLIFYTSVNVSPLTEKMRITASGNVGIGTSSPAGRLSVQTTTDNSIISIQSKDDRFAAVTFGDSKSHKSGQIQYHNIGNSMRFFTGEASANNSKERVRITGGGRVGIGISSPSVNLDVLGDLRTTGFIEAGRSTGGVALTMNDGNANVTFNHAYGKPSVNGSSARIETSVDETTGKMIFEVGDNSIANSTRALTQVMQLQTGLVDVFTNAKIHGRAAINSKLSVGGDFDGDYDLCVGGRSDEAGHVVLSGREGIISLRPRANTTHAWMFNAANAPAGKLTIASRKWNNVKGAYDDKIALSCQSDASVNISRALSIGSKPTIANGAPTDVKFSVRGSDDQSISSQFSGAIQVNQFDEKSRAYGFLSTNRGSAMVGGNLRLDAPSGSNIGKTAKVYISADSQYKLYHNNTLIGFETRSLTVGEHRFVITGNDKLGIITQNASGSAGLIFVVVVEGEIILTSNERDTVAVKELPGTFSQRWNIDFNLFNLENNVSVPAVNAQVFQSLSNVLADTGNARAIWVNNGTEFDRDFFFQTRLQEVNHGYVKGTNQRGSSAIQFIEGANDTGEISFLRATDTNDDTYLVTESARFDQNGNFGINTTTPSQTLDVNGNIKGNANLFLENDDYPQLVLANVGLMNKRFGIWRNKNTDQMMLGPQATNGNGTAAITINRNATVEFLAGAKVAKVDGNDNNSIATVGHVANAISNGNLTNIGNGNVFSATGSIKLTGSAGTSNARRGALSQITSVLRTRIPTAGAGHHSHGETFAALIASTSTADGGGLFLDVTDINNDEHALSIYNTATSIDKEVFHIRSKSGDTYTAGNIYARGGIASETKMVIGDVDSHFIVQKNSNNLNIVHKGDSASVTALSISSAGVVSLEKEPTGDKHVATKAYVDKNLNTQVVTTLPRFSSAAVNNENGSYAANAEFSFDIKGITGLTTAEVARVYAVDATIHNFGSNAHDYNTSYKYPDGEFREVQGSKGYNSDDDCGGSASILLPVSGSKVTFKSNVIGTTRTRSARKVVINGFWYYAASLLPPVTVTPVTPVTTSTVTPVTTSTGTPGIVTPNSFERVDSFEPLMYHAEGDYQFIQKMANSSEAHNVGTFGYAVPAIQPTYLAAFQRAREFNNLGYISVGTLVGGVGYASGADAGAAWSTANSDEVLDELKDFITTGGTLFITSEYSSNWYSTADGAKDNERSYATLISELGGINSNTTNYKEGWDPTYRLHDWMFSDGQTKNGRNHQSTYSGGTTNTAAVEEGIVRDTRYAEVSLVTTMGSSRIINAKSNGIPLLNPPHRTSLSQLQQPASSVIHLWHGNSGHLNSGVKGNIVWIGDGMQLGGISGNVRGMIQAVFDPLIVYLETNK